MKDKLRSSAIAVLVAMDEEVSVLQERYFHAGRLEGTFSPLYRATSRSSQVILCSTGIGKVNAALSAMEVIHRFDPGILIVTGLAGALHAGLNLGDVVVSSGSLQHDFDLRPLLASPGVMPGMKDALILAEPQLVSLARHTCEEILQQRQVDGMPGNIVMVGTVASGDSLISSSERKREISANFPGSLCVDMETAAVAQVARRTGRDWISIRVISDSADENFDLAEVLSFAAQEGSALIAGLVEALSGLA